MNIHCLTPNRAINAVYNHGNPVVEIDRVVISNESSKAVPVSAEPVQTTVGETLKA